MRISSVRALALHACAAASFAAAICMPTHAAETTGSTQVTIRVDQPDGTIHPELYGHFAEHLGRLIYEGIWVGEDSPIPNTRGIRNDVVAALKRLQIPVLRWPGGCYADEYHWRDGIGPRAQRPKRINASWGGVDTNAFGTHEFFDLVEMIGAQAYVNINVGTGSTQEMMEWLEYMMSDADSELANLRRKNGREQPWKVAYVGIGNEMWGCGGNMRPEHFADEYRRYSTFVKEYGGHTPVRIASGSHDSNYEWTEVLLSQAAKHMDAISLHYYTLPTSDWKVKGSATKFGEDQWHSTMVRTLRMDEYIRKHSEIMDKHDPEKKVGLMIAEWGTWYDAEPGRSDGALYQQSTVRDAVVAGANLNIFHQYTDRVRMANIAQMVNVLQAVILTDKERMVLTPTYHVFDLYKVHQGATALNVDLQTPDYTFGGASVPSVNVSASRDKAGKIHVSLVNLHPTQASPISLSFTGFTPRRATGQIITGPAMNSMNTFDRPDTVKPVAVKNVRVRDGKLVGELPSKSVVVLEVE